MLKKDARKEYMKKRDEISYSDRVKWDDLILIHFQTLDIPFIDYVLSFYPIEEKNEVNSILLTDYLHFKNPSLQICYPKTDFSTNTMHAINCHADSIFEPNSAGIMEPLDTDVVAPEEIDLIIIPMLICDMQGNRVGYGKGFYDRYLKNIRRDCMKVGVSYFTPIDRIEDTADFDVPLDFCITPERAYVF
ncbi:MAG TPA: 5-formyltetrahydrofolate cyclo-ligase [Flavisolibacter sp.]|nr:5-formyltetrahydrofolate cyclo-ligase [Flavisolibacter sp.]